MICALRIGRLDLQQKPKKGCVWSLSFAMGCGGSKSRDMSKGRTFDCVFCASFRRRALMWLVADISPECFQGTMFCTMLYCM